MEKERTRRGIIVTIDGGGRGRPVPTLSVDPRPVGKDLV